MMNKYVLASLLAMLGSSGWAHAQAALGTPVSGEYRNDSQPAGSSYQTQCQWDGKPGENHSILRNIGRTMTAPIRAAAGCLMPPQPVVVEAPPTRDDVARMISDGCSPAEITAAKIKIDEIQARARRAAVKYLATVDCHYYHEAEAGLIAALRADRVEAVRLEAALALGQCRGVTVHILDALNLAALGIDTDGNPAETSSAVRFAARDSLNRCLTRGIGMAPTTQAQWMPSAGWTPQATAIQPVDYVASAYVQPAFLASPVSAEERSRGETVSTSVRAPMPAPPARSLYQFLVNVRDSAAASAPPPTSDSYVRRVTSARMRGLTPLGSESSLAIPNSNSMPLPYNND